MDFSDIIFILFLVESIITRASGFQYRCFEDICDSSWQFCNEAAGEKRCNGCTVVQCEQQAAQHIFNQCQTFCDTQGSSTASTTTPRALTSTTSSTGLQMPETLDFVFYIIIMVMLLGLGITIIKYLRDIRNQQIQDIENRGSNRSNSCMSFTGGLEKVPLLTTSAVPVNPETSSSSSDHNKMADIRTLAQATTDQPQPPSYATEETFPGQACTPTSRCPCEPRSGINSNPSPEQDNGKSENFGETEILIKSETDQNQKEKDITRPKNL